MSIYLRRPKEVAEIVDMIERSGVDVPEVITRIDIDKAISAAALSHCETELDYRGGPMPEFEVGTPRWDAIVWDVFEHLNIDSTDSHLVEAAAS